MTGSLNQEVSWSRVFYSFGGLIIDSMVSVNLLSPATWGTPGLGTGTLLAFGATDQYIIGAQVEKETGHTSYFKIPMSALGTQNQAQAQR